MTIFRTINWTFSSSSFKKKTFAATFWCLFYELLPVIHHWCYGKKM